MVDLLVETAARAQDPQTVFPEVAVWGFSRIRMSFYVHARMLAYRVHGAAMLYLPCPHSP